MQELELYGYWRSSCTWRVRWALEYKGLPFREVAVNLLQSEQDSATHKARNPAGFVPALHLQGHYFGESMALLEWLEETHPAPALLPREPLARLYVRQLCQTIVSGTQPLQNLMVLNRYSTDTEERKLWARHFIARGLAVYETLLSSSPLANLSGPFSVGSSLTLADLCLVPQVYNAQRFEVPLEPFPRIRAIHAACLETASCKKSYPHDPS